MKNEFRRNLASSAILAVFLLTGINANAAGLDQANPALKPKARPALRPTPALPLLGIVKFYEGGPYPTDEEISVIAKMYKGIHVPGGPNRTQESFLWDKLRGKNPGFMVLPYFQSTLTSKVEVDVQMAEADPLNRISMYLEGSIEQTLSPRTEKFKVIPDNSKRGFGLKGSKTDGDFSKSTSDYIIMIRIGEEIMKVTSANLDSHEVTVRRGYKNTKAVTHDAGAKIFAPVYRGRPRKEGDIYGATSYYPDYSDAGDESIPQYHLRLDSKEISELLAVSGAEVIQKGATGLWLDLTSPGIFIPCNAFGQKVIPWNFERGENYTPATYSNQQERKCQNLRDSIRARTGITAQLVSNNHGEGKYFEEKGGGMNMVRPTNDKPIPIDGVILEAAFSLYQSRKWHELEQWKANLSTIIHGGHNKYPVWPWLKNIKYADYPMIKNAEADRFQFFDYTSTLLGYEKDAGLVCPIPLYWVDDKGERALNLPDYLFYDIGDPIERVPYDEIDKLLVPETRTYMRKWSKAIVLVNPTEADGLTIPIPAGYLDPATDQEVTQVAMAAHTGKILLKYE